MAEARPKTSIEARSELEKLALEIYGPTTGRFWATPRRSLKGRTPREALEAGDVKNVRGILIKAVTGDFS